MARSGSASRTSRGVSSCSAAVRTPTFMNLGANGVMVICSTVLGALGLNLLPGSAVSCAVEDGFDDAIGAVAVLEGSDGGRQVVAGRCVCGDRRVDVTHHVAERIGPRLLMPSWQVRI